MFQGLIKFLYQFRLKRAIIKRILWRNLEGSTIKNLQQDLNNPVIDKNKRVEQEKRVVEYLTVSKVKGQLIN